MEVFCEIGPPNLNPHSDFLSPPLAHTGLRRPSISICARLSRDLTGLTGQEGAGNMFRFLNLFVHILIHLAKLTPKLPVKKGTTCSPNLEDSRNKNSARTKDAVLVTRWIPENCRTENPPSSSRRILSAPSCLHMAALVCTPLHVPHWQSISSNSRLPSQLGFTHSSAFNPLPRGGLS